MHVYFTCMVDGAVQAHWPIAGSRVVNDVRGRRSRGGGFGNRQENTDEVSQRCDVSHLNICNCGIFSLFLSEK